MNGGLSTATVLDAGAGLVRRDGWSALSLRGVAATLGVTPMALYRHVPDSDALLTGVLDAIVAGAPTAQSTGDLAADLARWARDLHGYLSRFAGVAGRLLTAWFDCGPMLERLEDLLALVAEHGIEGYEAVAVTNALFTYVLMRGEAERQVRSAGVVRRRLRRASGGRELTRLQSLSQHYTTAQFDAHFEFGLGALIAGMGLKGRT